MTTCKGCHYWHEKKLTAAERLTQMTTAGTPLRQGTCYSLPPTPNLIQVKQGDMVVPQVILTRPSPSEDEPACHLFKPRSPH